MSRGGVSSPWLAAWQLREHTEARHRGCVLLLELRRHPDDAAATVFPEIDLSARIRASILAES